MPVNRIVAVYQIFDKLQEDALKRYQFSNVDTFQAANGATHKTIAKYFDAAELQCGLPPSPVHLAYENQPTSAYFQWDVQVSNDGRQYSNTLSITVYDSLCINCIKPDDCQQVVSVYILLCKYVNHV